MKTKAKKPTGKCPTPQQISQYEGVGGAVADRICNLIPKHPEIMHMTMASELNGIPGFNVDDLSPSYAQVAWALGAAKDKFKRGY